MPRPWPRFPGGQFADLVEEFTWLRARVRHIAAGTDHSLACADVNHGDESERCVLAWGRWDERLGIMRQVPDTEVHVVISQPRIVPELRNQPYIVRVHAGGAHSLCIGTHGKLMSWGDNTYGQLGTGDVVTRWNPFLCCENVISASAGERHTVCICAGGQVFVWGSNHCYQTGHTDGIHRVIPRAIHTLRGIEAVKIDTNAQCTLIVTKPFRKTFSGRLLLDRQLEQHKVAVEPLHDSKTVLQPPVLVATHSNDDEVNRSGCLGGCEYPA